MSAGILTDWNQQAQQSFYLDHVRTVFTYVLYQTYLFHQQTNRQTERLDWTTGDHFLQQQFFLLYLEFKIEWNKTKYYNYYVQRQKNEATEELSQKK